MQVDEDAAFIQGMCGRKRKEDIDLEEVKCL